jgi:hypothetical protein
MRDDWCVDGLEGMEEVEGVEAWNSPEFLQLSRRQQNVEIFKVKIVIKKNGYVFRHVHGKHIYS